MADEEKQAIELLRTIKRPTLATGFERQTNLLKALEQVLNLIEKQDKIIDEMAKWLYEEDNLFGFGIFKEINTPEKIKEYFKKKVGTEEK